jgi:hypothetical protein
VAYLAGAPYMRGCESREDFGEQLAPVEGARRENGCTIRLRAKDAGREVVFRQPDWVKHRFDAEDLEHRGLELTFMKSLTGFWWLEWGGMLDTVTDMREISTELTHIVYAVWDYMKNRSGLKDQLREYDLDWVSTMPGRRENRRFLGDYVLTQRDIDEQRKFHDGVAYGGFGYDDHAEEGIFHKAYANTHIYHLGPFEVPLRCLYSKAVDNLFLAGRNISVSHMALCGTRNMWTCLQFGEAVGAAAAVCAKWRLTPRKAALPKNVERVHELLHAADHTLFGAAYRCADDLAQHARIEASSTLESPVVERNDGSIRADFDCCALFPVTTAHLDALEIRVNAAEETEIRYQLMQGRPKLSTTPGEGLKEGAVRVPRGDGQWVRIPCDVEIVRRGWHFLRIQANPLIGVCYGNGAPVGLKAMYRHVPRNVENAKCVQITKNRDWDYLLDIWNEPSYCLRIYPPQRVYAPENVAGEWARPTFLPNLWISAPTDFSRPEHLTFEWGKISALDRLQLIFDTSIDNSLAVFQGDTNCQWGGYPAASVPAAVKDYRCWSAKRRKGHGSRC